MECRSAANSRGLAQETLLQALNNMIRGTQHQLLSKFFGQSMTGVDQALQSWRNSGRLNEGEFDGL